ncbi:MAG: hypothetical protein R3B09_32255 [Nannocystaceae bacterium]
MEIIEAQLEAEAQKIEARRQRLQEQLKRSRSENRRATLRQQLDELGQCHRRLRRTHARRAVLGSSQLRLSSGASLPVRLEVWPISDVITSHDPESWEVEPRYPPATQERRYHTDPGEQAKVRRIATDLDPALLLSDTPSPLDGPPIVTPEGIALGGNGRAMGIRTHYSRGLGLYEEALRAKTRRRALPHHPILVRVLEVEPTANMIRDLNKGLGGGLDLAAQAVAAGRGLPESVIDFLADHGWQLSKRQAREVAEQMIKSGRWTAQERGLVVDDGLSPVGTMLLRRAIAGRLLDDPDVLERLPARTRQLIERDGPVLLQASRVWPYLTNALRAAVADRLDFEKQIQSLPESQSRGERFDRVWSSRPLVPYPSTQEDGGKWFLRWILGGLGDDESLPDKLKRGYAAWPPGQITIEPRPTLDNLLAE